MIIDEKLLYYWLTSSNLSIIKQNLLLDHFGSIQNVYEAFLQKNSFLNNFFKNDNHKKILYNFLDMNILDKELDKLYSEGINILLKTEKYYPITLKFIDNAPNLLYYIGDVSLLNKICISIVGTRNCTRYGMDMTYRIVKDLVDCNMVIVSGLATGIDGFAHKATLQNSGKTIAVLGSGLYKITPTSNINLAKEIINKGLIISEFRPNFMGSIYSFPMRNRIISALSKGTVIIEAGLKSGALITAEYAAEQGKEVFAVPGNATSPQSYGTNDLIKNAGAIMITNGFEVCEYLHISKQDINKKVEPKQLNIFEMKIYELLKNQGSLNIDEIMNNLKCKLQELQITLLEMDLNGIIEREPNNYYKIL